MFMIYWWVYVYSTAFIRRRINYTYKYIHVFYTLKTFTQGPILKALRIFVASCPRTLLGCCKVTSTGLDETETTMGLVQQVFYSWINCFPSKTFPKGPGIVKCICVIQKNPQTCIYISPKHARQPIENLRITRLYDDLLALVNAMSLTRENILPDTVAWAVRIVTLNWFR